MERSYACIKCMKTFKVSSAGEPFAKIPETNVTVICPVCKTPNTVMLPQGVKFNVSRQN